MEAIKAAIGDALITFMWVFCSSMWGLFTTLIAATIGVQDHVWATLFISTVVLFVLLFLFALIGELMGGASFSPTGTTSFYAADVGGDNLFSLALRFPAQAAGAVGGALAILEVMPLQYKHMLGGPALKVDLHTGAIAEGVLTFLISFAVLVIILRGPRNLFVQNWLIAVVTVALVVTGSKYTGPSMNPANAFGWAYINKWHNTWEQFYVYWISPFIGATLAAWIFRLIFPPPAPKQKKA
ncbi:aquaporin SIP1-2 isoform X2 [Ricinus communis]|uniref:aquaporin SIP1-2 isoform X2 n=1 Tax=Ricinus communis TaxID=3988 RepID=UPI00201A2400|nr:aquaporin SIP1-2 isoform X2 [Ricinus communis]